METEQAIWSRVQTIIADIFDRAPEDIAPVFKIGHMIPDKPQLSRHIRNSRRHDRQSVHISSGRSGRQISVHRSDLILFQGSDGLRLFKPVVIPRIIVKQILQGTYADFFKKLFCLFADSF